jgi:hypothetical protein
MYRSRYSSDITLVEMVILVVLSLVVAFIWSMWNNTPKHAMSDYLQTSDESRILSYFNDSNVAKQFLKDWDEVTLACGDVRSVSATTVGGKRTPRQHIHQVFFYGGGYAKIHQYMRSAEIEVYSIEYDCEGAE